MPADTKNQSEHIKGADITASNESKSIKVKGTAYTGAKVSVGQFEHPIVIDLQGLEVPKEVPILTDHFNAVFNRVGVAQATKDDTAVYFDGNIFKAEEGPSREIIAQLEEGANWQLSIGADVEKYKFIDEGESLEVNGQTFEGPFYHVKKAKLREISVVAVGADGETEMKVAAKKIAASFVFSFSGGAHMPKNKKAQLQAEEEKKDRDEEEKKNAEAQEEDEEKAEMQDEEAPAWAKELMKGMASIAKAVGAEKPEEADEVAEPADQPEGGPVEQKANLKMLAKLSAKVDSLEKKTNDREKKDKETSLFESAMAQLKGYHVGDTTKEMLQLLSKNGDEAGIKTYIKDYKSTTPKDPEDTFAKFERSNVGSSDDPTVMEYQSQGPDVLKQVRVYARMWDKLSEKANGKPRWTLKEFIDIQMKDSLALKNGGK